MTRFRLTRPCTIRYQAPGPPDAHQNPSDLWTELETLCQFQQRGRQEIGDTGEVSDTTWLITLGTNITPPKAADQIVVDGLTYDFRGDSWQAHDMQGRFDHIEATATRAA